MQYTYWPDRFANRMRPPGAGFVLEALLPLGSSTTAPLPHGRGSERSRLRWARLGYTAARRDRRQCGHHEVRAAHLPAASRRLLHRVAESGRGVRLADMVIFFVILFSVPVMAIVWWIWAHRRLRRAPRTRLWQGAVAAFSFAFILTFLWMVLARLIELPMQPHPWLMAMLMLWGMIFLPLLGVPSMIVWSVWRLGRTLRQLAERFPIISARKQDTDLSSSAAAALADDEHFTRRQMIGASLVVFPMVASLGATAYSIPQKRRFRVREIEVPVNGLPHVLDGLRIAHLSDTHVGTFTHGDVLDRIVHETNRLDADLVLFTGDLINHSIEDLPVAMRMMTHLQPRDRIVMIEGNHDLFQGREAFVKGVREHDVPILLDESRTLRVRGYPVQVLGIEWHFRRTPIADHVDAAARSLDPDAFPILLAHHPHAFDRAAELGLPLTLAGHSHGGQIMLTPEFGGGPAIFKYWTGLYRHGNSSLIVSNGAGNWFPLRIGAPAEIVHLILRRV